MTIFKTVLTACILTLATLGDVVEAGAPASGDSIENVGYLIDSHNPVLERGDADLWSSSFNRTRYEFFVEHKVVDSRKVVCTIWSTAEESRGATKFRFPTRSQVIYTAPAGKRIKGFRFSARESFHTYSMDWEYEVDYRRGGVMTYSTILLPGAYNHWIGISGDDWGDDHHMYWDYYGQIHVKVADIDYGNLQYQGSMVSPSSNRGRSFGR